MFPPLNSTVQTGSVSAAELELQQSLTTGQGFAAHELQEKLLREARLSTSPLQRKLCEAAAEGMRMLSAHDCTLGWPVVKGGK